MNLERKNSSMQLKTEKVDAVEKNEFETEKLLYAIEKKQI